MTERRVSILVPFHADEEHRLRLWEWLRQFWRFELPDAEVIIGRDVNASDTVPFSKTAAVNEAFSRSCGDVIVILDADAYLSGEVIEHCAARLRSDRFHHVRSWFVPYQHMYRLTRRATEAVLDSAPWDPMRFPSPPWSCDVDDTHGSAGPGNGDRFGALIQIMPREAFELLGGMDLRFRGWGGEDVSFLRALDTLWGRRKTTPNDILHLWHPKFHVGELVKSQPYITRVWGAQVQAGANNWLSSRYNRATNKPTMMRELVDEGHLLGEDRRAWWHRLWRVLRRRWH